MREEAFKRIGHLYPKIEITKEMAKSRPDLKPLVGKKLTVIAWIWARTVKSPNPAFSHVDVPLASTFILSSRAGKEAWIEPIVKGTQYHFVVRMGKLPKDAENEGDRYNFFQPEFCIAESTFPSGVLTLFCSPLPLSSPLEGEGRVRGLLQNPGSIYFS